ncbi:hypothetical protein L7F22_011167 [Adiantum nelumboides]|nr:hypothetical protein [Adiantum nelumboides]
MKDKQSFKQRIEWDLQGRRQTFGVNACNFNARPTNGRLLWQAFMKAVFSDIWVPLDLFCGIILSVLSGVVDELSTVNDGLVFLCFLIIETVIHICVFYWQLKALLDLWMRQDQFQVQVVRFGIRWLISSCDIVVGDIVELRAGDKTPADGLLIERYSLQTSIQEHEGPVTFLASGTIVHNGFGTMLVTAVSNGTHQSFYECATADTPLLKHLKSFGSLVFKLRLYVSVLFMLLFFPFYFLGLYSSAPSGKYNAGQTRPVIVIYSILYEFYNSLTLIEVVVPEGLFFMVPLAMHYVLSRMTARHVSTCNPSSCELALGSITTICTGKSGVITHYGVTVESLCIAGHVCNETQTENQLLDTIADSIQSVMSQAIALNTAGNLHKEADLEEFKMSCGSAMEKGLLKWAYNKQMDIVGVRRTFSTLEVEPFHSDRRRSGVAVTRAEWGDKCVAHWKGAAEVILPSCCRRAFIDAESGQVATMDFSEEERSKVQDTILHMEESGGGCSVQNLLQETDLTLLAVVGMKNACKEEAKNHVRKAKEAGMRVIMVTGDSVSAARATAKESGILDEAGDANCVVDGAMFRRWKPGDWELGLSRLAVLARASQADKLLLVQNLQAYCPGGIVAITGHKVTDAEALKKADVGFALKIGTQVSKEKADFTLLDDSLGNIVASVRWARGLHCNIRQFAHLQIILSITVALIPTMKAAQYQWISLITTLAAIAFAWQAPLRNLMLKPPTPSLQPFFTYAMWRDASLQCAYQVFLFNWMLPYLDDNLFSTVQFNTVVFCQIMNIIIAHKLQDPMDMWEVVHKASRLLQNEAQRLEPDIPAVPEVKQPEPVPLRVITKSSGVVIEELPDEALVPSKSNHKKAKEWEQQRSTWKEKRKAKEFDE